MRDDYANMRVRAEMALADALDSLSREITSYPTPIAGCDAQYTHLLSERLRLRQAISALSEEVFIPTPRTLEPDAGVESR